MSEEKATAPTQLTITATKSGENVTFTLNEFNGKEAEYHRTYDCTIDGADNITFPNDLTLRIQTLCRAICLCMKYPNTYEGDSRPSESSPPYQGGVAAASADGVVLDDSTTQAAEPQTGDPFTRRGAI